MHWTLRGLLNVQYAVKDGAVHVLEANPRASRTVPFVSKATGVPLAKIAARVMAGATLAALRDEGLVRAPAGGGHVSVKEAVLPFQRFPDVDTILGPEMRSTGEVMGVDRSFGLAFAKSQVAAGNGLPASGTVFLSLADRDKRSGVDVARRFVELGFALAATSGTAAMLETEGLPVAVVVAKVGEGTGVDAIDLISSGKVDLVVNTPRGRGPRADGNHIRRAATRLHVPCITTVAAARAAAAASASAPRARRRFDRSRSTTATASCRSGSDMAKRSKQQVSKQPVDATVRLGPLQLDGPIVAASGTFGHGDEVARLCDPSRLGAVTAKSQAPFPWPGNPAPRLHPSACGMVNAVGLQGLGIDHWVEHDLPALCASGARVIASIWGHTVDDYAAAARRLASVADQLVAIEVNLSCPNLHGMAPALLVRT